jgi:hypothetical protein
MMEGRFATTERPSVANEPSAVRYIRAPAPCFNLPAAGRPDPRRVRYDPSLEGARVNVLRTFVL